MDSFWVRLSRSCAYKLHTLSPPQTGQCLPAAFFEARSSLRTRSVQLTSFFSRRPLNSILRRSSAVSWSLSLIPFLPSSLCTAPALLGPPLARYRRTMSSRLRVGQQGEDCHNLESDSAGAEESRRAQDGCGEVVRISDGNRGGHSAAGRRKNRDYSPGCENLKRTETVMVTQPYGRNPISRKEVL